MDLQSLYNQYREEIEKLRTLASDFSRAGQVAYLNQVQACKYVKAQIMALENGLN